MEVGLISWDQIAGSAAPLDAALRQATSSELVLGFVSVSALFATASVVMSSMLGGSRALFAMGRKGVLPKSFARVSGRGVPVTTVVLAGLSMAAVVLLTRGDIALLASAFNFGTLITFLFINLSLIKLRRSRPGAPRSFRVPLYPAPPALGILSCLALMAFLNPNAIIIGLAWIALGYLVYHRSRRKGEGSAAQGGDQHV